jgi:hypothetical protein
MDSISFPDGFHNISRVESNGIQVISLWNHDFTLIPHHFQSGFHMESIWNELICI